MQILILGLNYAPEPIGIGPYTAALAEYLAARGHDVTVIAGNPYYPDWELAEGFDQCVSSSISGGVKVIRVPHYIPEKPTALKRIAHHLSYAKNARAYAKRYKSADLVVAIAPALLAAPVALEVARRCGAASWLHIQDFEVEAALATGLLSRGPIAALATGFEKRAISRFDWVSSISQRMVARVSNKGGDPARTIELRNWAEDSVQPSNHGASKMREELRIPPGTIALYSGNLALKQGSELIVEAAKLLEEDCDIQLVVCGTGPARERLEQASRNLPNLHIRDLQPRGMLNDLLALADIHMLPQIEGAADLVLPSKLSNMLASGRPVVTTAAAGTGLAAEVEGCGLITPPGDAWAFAGAIKVLAENPAQRLALGKSASARAKERWTSSVLLERFALAFEKAVTEREKA